MLHVTIHANNIRWLKNLVKRGVLSKEISHFKDIIVKTLTNALGNRRDQFVAHVPEAALQRFEGVAGCDVLFDNEPTTPGSLCPLNKERKVQIPMTHLRHERWLAVLGSDAKILQMKAN